MKQMFFRITENRILLRLTLVIVIVIAAVVLFLHQFISNQSVSPSNIKLVSGALDKSKLKTDAEWKKILTADQYHILREAGTEVPFTGKLEYENRKGTYYSAGCKEPVFRSETKYDSKTGWPSFDQPISADSLVLREDDSLGAPRIEVLDKCGGHLGH